VSINNNGIGQGKDTAIRAIMGKLKVTSIRDITAIPHNGCKPPKKPR
jgi:small subunit ribosomal protein S11